jgi:hypothetical protein
VLELDISQYGKSGDEQKFKAHQCDKGKKLQVQICTLTVLLFIKELKTNQNHLNWVA